jgi:hypothetical protein
MDEPIDEGGAFIAQSLLQSLSSEHCLLWDKAFNT